MNKYKHIYKRQKDNNAGFTLVEMMVTITVLAIVMGLTAFGILAWQDWSRFNQQNQYAQTLFIAAQNQLSEFAANGRLEEMQQSLGVWEDDDYEEDEAKAKERLNKQQAADYGFNLTGCIGNILIDDGKHYNLSEIFKASKDDKKYYNYQDKIIALRAESGEYDEYLADPDDYKISNPEAYWVFEILGPYVYDKSILNGGRDANVAICLEITPRDGQVFAVLYSDRHEAFEYAAEDMNDNIVTSKSDVADISNRTESIRRDNMIGYYGADTLTKATRNKSKRLSVKELKLCNEDLFYLETRLNDSIWLNSKTVKYEIDLVDSADMRKKISIEFIGGSIYPIEDKQIVNCKTAMYDGDTKHELGDLPYYAWIEKGRALCIAFDAADIQATTRLYEDEFDDIHDKSKVADTEFAKTSSFFRFGLDTGDLKAEVVVKSESHKDSKKKISKAENPVFGSLKIDNSLGDNVKLVYTLKNARHLYNVRYIEDLDYDPLTGNDKASGFADVKTVSFKVDENIDFEKFQEDGYLFDATENSVLKTMYKVDLSRLNGEIYDLSDNVILVNDRTTCHFPSFRMLRQEDSFLGKDRLISGINISENSNFAYHVIKYTLIGPDGVEIEPEKAEPGVKYKVEIKEKQTGLFNECYGTIIDLSMDAFRVEGSENVGAFCGVNKGFLKNLSTKEPDKKNVQNIQKVSGEKAVGGIVGYQYSEDPEADEPIVSDLNSYAEVSGEQAVGGIVGRVREDEQTEDYKITISDCENYGQVHGEQAVGGVVGRVRNDGKTNCKIKVSGCNNYGQVYGCIYTPTNSKGKALANGQDLEAEKIKYIGGIVGYCYNKKATGNTDNSGLITIQNCESSMRYTNAEINSLLSNLDALNKRLKGVYVGGIVGYNYNGTIANCATKAVKGYISCVTGYRYVGGIVGLNNGPIIEGEYNNKKGSNESNVIGCYYAGGITGANAAILGIKDGNGNNVDPDPENEKIKDAIFVPQTERDLSATIKNWTNRGVVVATEQYAGGITGYNTGWIYGCESDVSATVVDQYFSKLETAKANAGETLGDYCGGIAGYNNGIIGNTERELDGSIADGKTTDGTIKANIYVNGHDYVGGIVGYNDTDAVVEDYEVQGGYVKSDQGGSFVGGYAGLNASLDLLMKQDYRLDGTDYMELTEDQRRNFAREIKSNPNKVEGGYFVGGSIGGNIINTNGVVATTEKPVTPPVGEDSDIKVIPDKVVIPQDVSFNTRQGVYGIVRNLQQYDNNGDFCVRGDLSVYNDTDTDISSWKWLLPKSIGVKKFNGVTNIQYYSNNHAITYNNYTSEVVGAHSSEPENGNNGYYFDITFNDEKSRSIFVEKYNNQQQFDIYYFIDGDNKPGTYWGDAVDEGKNICNFEITKSAGNDENSVRYSVDIGNIGINCSLPNWRVDYKLPDGFEYESIAVAGNNDAENKYKVEVKNGILSLSANAAGQSVSYFPLNQIIYDELSIVVVAKDEKQLAKLTNENFVLTFNNVVYAVRNLGGTDEVTVPVDTPVRATQTESLNYWMGGSQNVKVDNGKFESEQISITIQNNVGKDVSGWKLDLSGISGDFDLVPSDNSAQFDKNDKVLHWTSKNSATLGKNWEQKTISFKVVSDLETVTKNVLSAISSNKVKVLYSDMDSVINGAYVGKAAKEDDISFDISEEGNWTEKSEDVQNGRLDYVIALKNNSSVAMPNWKIEFTIPSYVNNVEKKDLSSDAGINLKVNGTTVTITSDSLEGNVLGVEEEKKIVLRIIVDAAYSNTFNESYLRGSDINFCVSSNGILYKGNADVNQNYITVTSPVVGTPIVPDIDRPDTPSKPETVIVTKVKNIYTNFETNNFLGTLKGEEFVGGFVGYNLLFDATERDNDPATMTDVEKWIDDIEKEKKAAKEADPSLVIEEEDYKGAAYVVQRSILKAFEAIDKDNNSDTEEADEIRLTQKKEYIDNISYIKETDENGGPIIPSSDRFQVAESSATMLVLGKENKKSVSSLGRITGKIYVGGVIGYNDDNTSLCIEHVKNATPVVATKAIKYYKEQLDSNAKEINVNGETYRPRATDYLGRTILSIDDNGDITEDTDMYRYSYSGGIVGKVAKNTIIDNCINASSGTVDTKGTYRGGICEINDGIIINCEINSFGTGVEDYIGGLCGLNKSTITRCYFAKTCNISGRNVVGGIVAENFGTITSIFNDDDTNPRIKVFGDSAKDGDGVAGLYAAVNGSAGTTRGIITLGNVQLTKEEEEAGNVVYEPFDFKNINVESDGNFVGGVVGINEGSIRNGMISDSQEDAEKMIVISGNVEGSYDVGALIGLNKDSSNGEIKYFDNKATILAKSGNAGGIIGSNESNSTITKCANHGTVSATVGNAGGITTYNYGTITKCNGYNSVSAPKGMCGGIVAYNGDQTHKDAKIEECYVGSKENEIVFKSGVSVGGIAAKNYGTIGKNTLENVIATNKDSNVLNTSIGCVVGDNEITGEIFFQVDENIPGINGCKAIATTNNCNVGGVAGTNDGIITTVEGETGYALIGAIVEMNGASYASMGGVTGLNTGTISNCQVVAKINGYLGTETTGYGGIAGYNGYSTKALYTSGKNRHSADSDYHAQIINCTFDGYMRADGSAGNPANIGGMTGVNGYGGYIAECAIGVRDKDINGINDDNTTKILSGNFEKYGKSHDKANNAILDPDKNSYAYVGGIAGRNYAQITDIDMYEKSVDTSIEIMSFAGATGGMVGYQYGGASLSGYVDEDGEEHWITSPSTMRVEMMLGENDYGVGGIIGYDRSSEDIAYIKNYANVVNYVNMNVKTGGIIGTIEQQKVRIVNVNKCENYGKIEGLMQVGGIFGRTKFCSVNMEDCINYGEIYATNGGAGGLIARIYDIQNTDVYMTNCINYGYVHAKGSTYVGGLLGNLDSSKNITAHIYDCDNVGIVERDSNANFGTIKPATSIQNTVGSLVGNGSSGTWYFEQCQNYNHSVTANGFVGNQGVVKLKDCLDDSGYKTNSEKTSPFYGTGVTYSTANMAGSSSAQNAYYIDSESRHTPESVEKLSKDGGAYFTYGLYTTDGNNAWNGNKYKDIKNPRLYLEAPATDNFIQQSNNTKIEFNLAYDYEKCKGIKAFNIYFWNGKMDNTAIVYAKYTVTATFRDKNGISKDVVVKKVNVTNNMEDDKVTLTVPEELDSDIQYIAIHVLGEQLNADGSYKLNDKGAIQYTSAYYHGFSYDGIDNSGESKEYACAYMTDKTDTSFHIAELYNGSAVKTSADDIKPRSVYSLDDLLGMRVNPEEKIKLTKNAATGKYKLTFDVILGENSVGMDSFVFYPGNSVGSDPVRTYYYDYEAEFVDTNGDVSTKIIGKAVGYNSDHEYYWNPAVIKVPDGFSNDITRVILSFGDISYSIDDGVTFTNNQKEIFLRGFGWIPKGGSAIEPMGIGSFPIVKPNEYDGFASGITRLHCDYTDKGGSATAPYVYSEYDHDAGFNMDSNDPAADVYFADRDEFAISSSKEDGSSSRINVYNDIHPKFQEFVQKQYVIERKLDTPVPTASDTNGTYKVTWLYIPGAYEYELRYIVKDAEGNAIVESPIITLGGETTSYSMASRSDEWVGCDVIFSLKAVNAYRYQHPEDETNAEKYDSEWGSAKISSKKVLPQPESHLELTAANKVVAVLDNREDYLADDGEGYIDCVVEARFVNKKNVETKFTINVADGFVSTDSKKLSANDIADDHNFYAKAKPTTGSAPYFSESSELYTRGHFVDNELLVSTDQYPDSKGKNAVEYRGFYGTDANQMTYTVYYNVESRDSFVKADIVSYDKELDMNVSYSSMETHTAGTSGTASFTATLSDLPAEWFAEDFAEEIIARSYIISSQYHYMDYGHTVAKDVTAADIRDVKDPYYLADDADGIVKENVSIFDENGDLKPGYTVQLKYDKNGQKLYDIFYYANIELAEKAAEEDSKYVGLYKNYCVGYRQYKAVKNTVSDENSDTNVKLDVKYAATNKFDYQETYVVNGNGLEGHTIDNADVTCVQEIQPAPIIDKDAEEVPDEKGIKSYVFTFDEYFEDANCISDQKYTSLTGFDSDSLATWKVFKLKTGYDSLSDAEKLKALNTYYATYSNATYRVDFLGKTKSGDEAVIATVTTTEANHKDITTSDDVYNKYCYEVTFTDSDNTWKNYSDYRIRVMRFGSNSGLNGETYANGNVYILPRYTDYSLHVLHKYDKIIAPTVTLHSENGVFITTDLIYDVKFTGVSGEDKLEDLGGYIITASKQDDEGNIVYSYYVIDMTEGSDSELFTAKELEALNAKGTVTALGADDYVDAGATITAMLDLSEFEKGDKVDISVQAIAKVDAVNYADSDAGYVTTIEIADRIDTPMVTKLLPDTADGGMEESTADAINVVDYAAYEKNMYLKYDIADDTRYESYADAKMLLAIAAYGNNDALDKNLHTKGDSDGTASDAWNYGALATFNTKSESGNFEPMDMGYIKDNNAVKIDIRSHEKYIGELAGSWLKVVAKAASGSKIDSPWTDEDAAEKTDNYRWIHIPNLKLKDVELREEVVEEIDEYENSYQHLVLSMNENKCLDEYDMTIEGTNYEVLDDEGNVVQIVAPAYTMSLRKHLDENGAYDGTLDVWLKNQSKDVTDPDNIIELNETGEAGICGNINIYSDEEQIVTLAYPDAEGNLIEIVREIFDDNDDSQGEFNAKIKYIPGTNPGDANGTLQLVLPDLADVTNDKANVTSNVAVAVAADIERYVVGKTSRWLRAKDEDDNNITKIEMIGDDTP